VSLILMMSRVLPNGEGFWTPPPRPPHSRRFLGWSFDGDESAKATPTSTVLHSPWTNMDLAPAKDAAILSFGDRNVTNVVNNNLIILGGNESNASIGANTCRGGGGGTSEILDGGIAALSRAAHFWQSTFSTAFAVVQRPFEGMFQSKTQRKEQELLHQLQTMTVQRVSVPNSTVLPENVVRMAVQRSGLIGSPLRTDRVQEFARQLKRWYVRQGYVLHSVTGATLKPESATAEITVDEPLVSPQQPVDIVFCKEMVIDDDTGELFTFRQYREKKVKELQSSRASSSTLNKRFQRLDKRLERKDLNTTMVTTTGRTRASKVASAMKLEPGQPFQWHEKRWKKIATSGIFSKILRTGPERTSDGGVCLQVFVVEPPARHLEYGVGKSVWTNSWEGEVDFDWRNIFGGGESLGVLVRRGTKDSSPSVRMRYGDDKFGLEGGYDVELFSDFLGDTPKDIKNEETSLEASLTEKTLDTDEDSLLHRRGATFRLRNPITPSLVSNSVGSASLERTSTTTGQHESIGSATLTLGPFRKLLPMDARSSISTTITGGTRLQGIREALTTTGSSDRSVSSFLSASQCKPYSFASATTRQILPIYVSSSGDDGTPITLAFQHTISTSTPNLPRHEAKAMGNAAQIRGASPNGPASSALKGTTEVRVPIAVPRLGSGSVVLFGDWFFLQQELGSKYYSKSSIGVGIRTPIQGLPFKYDISYSSEGKIKSMFGLGPDFDV
jgi:outer membrane protein assembly factor BamA